MPTGRSVRQLEVPKRQLAARTDHFDDIEVGDPDAENFEFSIIGLDEDWRELDNLGYASDQSLEEENSTCNLGISIT